MISPSATAPLRRGGSGRCPRLDETMNTTALFSQFSLQPLPGPRLIELRQWLPEDQQTVAEKTRGVRVEWCEPDPDICRPRWGITHTWGLTPDEELVLKSVTQQEWARAHAIAMSIGVERPLGNLVVEN